MMELRVKIAREIEASEEQGDSYETTADRILAIPEIAEALEERAKQTALNERNAQARLAMRAAPLHKVHPR